MACTLKVASIEPEGSQVKRALQRPKARRAWLNVASCTGMCGSSALCMGAISAQPRPGHVQKHQRTVLHMSPSCGCCSAPCALAAREERVISP